MSGEIFKILDRLINDEIKKQQMLAIYPLGKIGLQAKNILKKKYGLNAVIIDNYLAHYNQEILNIDEFEKIDEYKVTIIICTFEPLLNKKITKDLEKRRLKARVRNILN